MRDAGGRFRAVLIGVGLLSFTLTSGPAAAGNVGELEQNIRKDLERSAVAQRQLSARVLNVPNATVAPELRRDLVAQGESLEAIGSQVAELATLAREEEAKKEAISAGFFVSLFANDVASLGLFLQIRGSRQARELNRLQIEKTRLELDQLRA